MSKMQTPAITLWFPEKCLSRFFFLRNNLLVKRFQHSICISSIITKTNTEISFSFWWTLFYSIPLLALTDGQTDRRTEERIHSLCVGWRNPFLCQFIAYDIGSFFVVAENFHYNRKKKDTVVCLAGARSLLRPEEKKF